MLETKNNIIQYLKRQLHELLVAKQEEAEKVEELELYIKMQEEHYSDHSVQLVLDKVEIHEKYEELKEKNKELADKYEEKWLALLVAEAKINGINESTQNQVFYLKRNK
mgnify:CR=1 FL=1